MVIGWDSSSEEVGGMYDKRVMGDEGRPHGV